MEIILPVKELSKYIPSIKEGIIFYQRRWDYYKYLLAKDLKYCEGLRDIKEGYREREDEIKKEIIIKEKEEDVRRFIDRIELKLVREKYPHLSIPHRKCKFLLTENFLGQVKELLNTVFILERPVVRKIIYNSTIELYQNKLINLFGGITRSIGLTVAYRETEKNVYVRIIAISYPVICFEHCMKLFKKEKSPLLITLGFTF